MDINIVHCVQYNRNIHLELLRDLNYHVNHFELQLVFDESLWPGIRLTNSTSEPLFNSADTPTGNNELQRR